ncbi:MAG: C1 family peptidase [Oscillospiraceae bacterium]
MKDSITNDELKEFSESFKSDKSNILAMNTVTSNGVDNSARQFTSVRAVSHVYSVSLDQHGITWQKNSGRCWMFSSFNTLRDKLINKLDLEEFAFSGNYLMFYDKLEKSNLYLESILKYIDEPSDSRIMMLLNRGLLGDGGNWSMFVGLVKKYGVVPDYAQPETFPTDNSNTTVPVIKEKLREYACELRRGHKAGKTMEQLRNDKEAMLNTIYRMLCISYGEPVESFDFKVRNKSGEFICDRGITPIEFYNKYVSVDLDQYIIITAGHTNGREIKKYCCIDSGSVIENGPMNYVSVPVSTLKEAAIAQLKAGEPVCFGCDVLKRMWREKGILDDNLYGYEKLFNIDLDIDREDRLLYGIAMLNHAMVFKGVDLDENGQPLTWRVENSWGPDVGSKGMFTMTDDWFEKYTYQIVVNKKFVSEEIRKVYDGDEAIELERWQVIA